MLLEPLRHGPAPLDRGFLVHAPGIQLAAADYMIDDAGSALGGFDRGHVLGVIGMAPNGMPKRRASAAIAK